MPTETGKAIGNAGTKRTPIHVEVRRMRHRSVVPLALAAERQYRWADEMVSRSLE